MFGTPIDIGDKVVVAFPEGRSSAVLRVGTIESFYEKEQPPYWNNQTRSYLQRPANRKVVVDWDRDFGGWATPDKPSKVSPDSERFLKIK
jgi:hypothetical protein